MKAPSAPWQTVTLPVCLKYEELFQQFSSILDSLKLSDQQGSLHSDHGIPMESWDAQVESRKPHVLH